jgi:hypothetical protein
MGRDAMSSGKVASKDVNVLVTVADSHRAELDAVAESLSAAGMSVAQKFKLGGVIAGEVPRHRLGAIRKCEGVSSVEEEPHFKAV